MTRTRFKLALLLAAALPLATPPSAAAQIRITDNTLRLDEAMPRPAAKIADVGWMAGYWRGDGLDGVCEEIWSQPSGDRMQGIFTLSKADGLVLSEAMTLVEEEGSLVLKVKHFTPEFVGWEEKDGFVSFPLVRLGENEAYFRGLTFRRVDDQTLLIYLVLTQGDQKTEYELRLARVPF